jgi:sulfatase modifying factor 1
LISNQLQKLFAGIFCARLLTVACVIMLLQNCSSPSRGSLEDNNESGVVFGDMVFIPGGEFTMGATGEKPGVNAQSPHPVKVSAFWIDETEVTNAQFKKFADETHYVTVAERKIDWEELKKQVPAGTPKPPDDMLQPGSMVFTPPNVPVLLNDYSQWWSWVTGADWKHPQGPGSSIEGKDSYPVVQIAYEDAERYAAWAGKRLPTEAEFEFAARGGISGKCYAWGDELSPDGKYLANYFQGSFPNANTGEDGFKGVAPVRSFPPNGYKLYDMIGNVWELCSDWYGVEPPDLKVAPLQINPAGPASTIDPTDPLAIKHVSKGGSFLCSVQYCSNYKPSGRQGTAYDSGMDHTGFRCVSSAE